MKQQKGKARLIMYAGVSKPNPKLGQVLGPLGMNMMQFCKEFNGKTAHIRSDIPMRVQLKAYTDRTYDYAIKPPLTSWYLKRIAMLPFGSYAHNHRLFTGIGVKYIYELAKIKKEFDEDFKDQDLKAIVIQILAQARRMGLYLLKDIDIPKITTPDKF
jgi:large subunit ribosomal protein L11